MLYETQFKEKTSSTKQFMVIAPFLLLFFCDRSSRWDSELRAQLPWEPNSRGNWTPVGGRTRRTKRGGSCQGRPDSSHHVGLQRVFMKRLTMALFPYRTSHRGKTWRKIVTAVNVALDKTWNLHYSSLISWYRWFGSSLFLFKSERDWMQWNDGKVQVVHTLVK